MDVGTMPDVATGWKRLGELIEAEVRARRVSWVAFIRHSGLSKSTVYDLRAGARTTYDPQTLARLEYALGWKHGSVAKAIEGRAPDRVPDPLKARFDQAWTRLTPEVRALLTDLAERSAER